MKFDRVDEFLHYYVDLNYRYDILYLNDKEMYKDLFEYAHARKANPIYQALLGYLYKYGEGVEKNLVASFEWFYKASSGGHGYAMYELGLMYEKGNCIQQDFNQAFSWYSKASELGVDAAINNLGLFYEKGIACTQNMEYAFNLYLKAAELGNKSAITNVALCYRMGKGVGLDYAKSFSWYK